MKSKIWNMLSVFLFFVILFISMANKVVFLGFLLVLLSMSIVFFLWVNVSQWMSLILFLVYMTGVMVIFMFFCSFSSSVGSLVYNPFFTFMFFLLLEVSGSGEFFEFDSNVLCFMTEFYSISELLQLVLLGLWLIYVLWGAFKMLKVSSGVLRLIKSMN